MCAHIKIMPSNCSQSTPAWITFFFSYLVCNNYYVGTDTGEPHPHADCPVFTTLKMWECTVSWGQSMCSTMSRYNGHTDMLSLAIIIQTNLMVEIGIYHHETDNWLEEWLRHSILN